MISGMRKSCDLAIYLNVELALAKGLCLYSSANGVIVTPGFDGAVPTELFLRVARLDGDGSIIRTPVGVGEDAPWPPWEVAPLDGVEGSEQSPWHGRGLNRRAHFLRSLGGRGAARGAADSDLGCHVSAGSGQLHLQREEQHQSVLQRSAQQPAGQQQSVGAAEAECEASSSWCGRGLDRRAFFLGMLAGRGAARVAVESQNGNERPPAYVFGTKDARDV